MDSNEGVGVQALLHSGHGLSNGIDTTTGIQIHVVSCSFNPLDLVTTQQKLLAELLDQEALGPLHPKLGFTFSNGPGLTNQTAAQEAIHIQREDDRDLGHRILSELVEEFE